MNLRGESFEVAQGVLVIDPEPIENPFPDFGWSLRVEATIFLTPASLFCRSNSRAKMTDSMGGSFHFLAPLRSSHSPVLFSSSCQSSSSFSRRAHVAISAIVIFPSGLLRQCWSKTTPAEVVAMGAVCELAGLIEIKKQKQSPKIGVITMNHYIGGRVSRIA